MYLVFSTYGTNDMLSWNEFLEKINTDGGLALYRDVPLFNHPPFMIHLLRFWGRLGALANIPLQVSLRGTSVLAGAAATLLLWQLVNAGSIRISRPALVITILSPVTILVAGFHGNTDPLMIFFVILAACLADAGYSPWLAGLSLGMAVNIKLPAILAAPALFFWMPRAKRSALATAASATFLIGSLPWIVTAPQLIAVRVFAYRGLTGMWGITLLPGILAEKLGHPRLFLTAVAVEKVWLLLALVGLARWMNRLPHRPPVFVQCGFIYCFFLAFSPGYGIQYLSWLVIWPLVLGAPACLFWNLTAGAFIFANYAFWAGGFPWYLAESRGITTQPAYLYVLGQICWLVVIWLAYRFWKEVRAGEMPARQAIGG